MEAREFFGLLQGRMKLSECGHLNMSGFGECGGWSGRAG